jgi:serine/threonine-protein kinase RIO1
VPQHLTREAEQNADDRKTEHQVVDPAKELGIAQLRTHDGIKEAAECREAVKEATMRVPAKDVVLV